MTVEIPREALIEMAAVARKNREAEETEIEPDHQPAYTIDQLIEGLLVTAYDDDAVIADLTAVAVACYTLKGEPAISVLTTPDAGRIVELGLVEHLRQEFKVT